MKFPSHIILDVKTHGKEINLNSWTISFENKTTPYTANLQNYTNFNAQSHLNPITFSSFYARHNTSTLTSPSTNTHMIPDGAPVNNPLWNMFNVSFLRKERIYTKLKYSRCPQYDIVSGGVAALFSGFLGFLICEKFGLELLDSGDFYVFFMYVVFASFSLRPLFLIANKSDTLWHVLTLSSLYSFLRDLLILLFRTPWRLINRIIYQTNLYLIPWKTLFWKFQYVTELYHFWRRVYLFLTNWPMKGYTTFREVK